VRFVLGRIQDYCLEAKLPPLTIVVVNQAHGQPGTGFIAWDVDDWHEGLRQVHEYPWQKRPNPFIFAEHGSTPTQLAERLVHEPEHAAEIYRRIRDRGYIQIVFRKALLLAYKSQCAFCGLSFPNALDAAHIISWSDASPAQRISPSNGLLLCATHHKLFDAGILTVSKAWTIACDPGHVRGHHWNDVDHQAAMSLDGQRIRLPEDERLRPSHVSIEHRSSRPSRSQHF
jgi:putative restriction endonuclease